MDVANAAHNAYQNLQSSATDMWGTAPTWITAGAALIVGCFTVYGILTARRSYKDSVWQTKVKVARLIYCDVEMTNNADQGQPFTGFRLRDFNHWYGEDHYLTERGMSAYGFLDGHAARDVAGFHVTVKNNSDEPVGGAWLKVLSPLNQTPVPTTSLMLLGTIDPGETKECAIIIPRNWAAELTSDAGIELTFTDSAGVHWKRLETEPPKEEK